MQRLAKRLQDVQAQHKAAVAEAQRTCPHTSVLEAQSKNGILFYWPPLRVCQACGFTEEGFHFRVLTTTALEVSRDQAVEIGRRAVWAP